MQGSQALDVSVNSLFPTCYRNLTAEVQGNDLQLKLPVYNACKLRENMVSTTVVTWKPDLPFPARRRLRNGSMDRSSLYGFLAALENLPSYLDFCGINKLQEVLLISSSAIAVFFPGQITISFSLLKSMDYIPVTWMGRSGFSLPIFL